MSRHAAVVAAGILLSRIAGLVRDRFFAHYFGDSDAADVFRAAFRIPNLLQNLFGEGVLSASFIPVYAGLLARKQEDEAARVASAIFCLLSLVLSCLVLAGILATPLMIQVIAPGFKGAKLELCVTLVRILFPGAGILVISAWCLGILNSHRRFFASYTAPVAWNLVMIASLCVFGARMGQFPLTRVLAWGSVIGSVVQVGVQVPQLLPLIHGFRLLLGLAMDSVRTIIRNFMPMLVSRGVVQVSAYVDTMIASFLPTGCLAALVYAQTLYVLPVSLFGMSVSAAELPALSSALGDVDEKAAYLRKRLDAGLRQIAFFVVPSAVGFLSLGDVIAGTIYQTGRFTHGDSVYVWAILAGSAIGLLATTLGRLYASAHYALQDTRTPLRYAIARVVVTGLLGYFCALPLPPLLGIEARFGVVGLTASAGLAGWLEFALLRRSLNARIGTTGVPGAFLTRLWIAAAAAAGAAWCVKVAIGQGWPLLLGLCCLGTYGLAYFALAAAMGVPEVRGLFERIAGWRGQRRKA